MDTWSVTLTVGFKANYLTLTEAFKHIPYGSSTVLLVVLTDLVQDRELNIPTNLQIRYIKITTKDNVQHKLDFWGCNFFCNGIQLEIDKPVTLQNCFLFAGSKAEKGEQISRDYSYIVLKGKADYVFGGGYAIGRESTSEVKKSTIELIDGQAAYLYGGGYAVHQGIVNHAQININMNSQSTVSEELHGGSCLPGPESCSTINEINLNLSGKIDGLVSLCGYAAFGAAIYVKEIIRLNASEARFQGNIYDKRTVGPLGIINIAKITGFLSQKYQKLLHIPFSDIQIIQPESEPVIEPVKDMKQKSFVAEIPTEIKTDIKPETSYQHSRSWVKDIPQKTTSSTLLSNKTNPHSTKKNIYEQHVSQASKAKSKNKDGISGCGIILIGLFFCFILLAIHMYSTEKNGSLPTSTISIINNTKISVNNTATYSVDTNKVKTTSPTTINNAVIHENIIFTPFIAHTDIPTNQSKLNTPTIIIPSLTNTTEYTAIQSETPLPSTLTPTEMTISRLTQVAKSTKYDNIATENPISAPRENPTKPPQFGIIQDETALGAYFYVFHYRADENIIRFLSNGTQLKILEGPVNADNTEWYQVYVEQYNRTGWVIRRSVILNND